MAVRDGIKGKNLYQVLFYGVIITAVAVVALAYWGVREIRRDAAVVAVESSARGLAGAVNVLMEAVANANGEIGTDFLSDLRPAGLRKAITRAFRHHDTLTSVMVSDDTGLLYMITRRPDSYLEVVPDPKSNETHWTLWDRKGKGAPFTPAQTFDRQLVDSTLAKEIVNLKPGEVSWHSTYRLHPSGESWLSASVLMDRNDRNYMVSYLFPIDAVINRLGSAEKGSAEKVFLFWDSGKVLPVSADSKGAESGKVVGFRASKALEADKVEDPVIAGAARALADNRSMRTKPFSYKVDKEVWWAYVMPLAIFGDTISLGVAISKSNAMSTLTSDTFLQVFTSILVICAGVALVVLRRNRARIEVLGLRQKAAKTPEDILRLIAEGEGRTLEFKQTLRFNLKAGKNGKEIEHASLKTVAGFFNSEGGTLLIGVADNGKVTGFKEDRFANEDKALLHLNNLVNQHIGPEFARYVDTAIIEVQDHWVLRVYCMPAAAPAILHSGKDEEFYVRSGPASRQLTLSQFYEWVQNHSK